MGITSTKTFQCLEEFSIDDLEKRLKKFSKKEREILNSETGGTEILHTDIKKIKKYEEKNIVRGYMSYDTVVEIKQREGPVKFIVTPNEVQFSFILGSTYFVVFAPSAEANNITTEMNSILFENMRDPPILACNIIPPQIEDFLVHNPNEITNCWWKNVNIPNLSRAGLGGSGIQHTSDFRRFDNHGDKGSIRLRLLENGWSILINQYASVVFYTNADREDIEDFLRREIIPRCN